MACIRLTDLDGKLILLETRTVNSIIDCDGRRGVGSLIFFEDESHIKVKETYGEIVKKIEAAQLT